MFKARLTRLEPEYHRNCKDRSVYEGLIAAEPLNHFRFVVYKTKEELLKIPKYRDYVSGFDKYVPIVETSFINELFINDSKTAFFRTQSESFYKLEILSEDFSFSPPFNPYDDSDS